MAPQSSENAACAPQQGVRSEEKRGASPAWGGGSEVRRAGLSALGPPSETRRQGSMLGDLVPRSRTRRRAHCLAAENSVS